VSQVSFLVNISLAAARVESCAQASRTGSRASISASNLPALTICALTALWRATGDLTRSKKAGRSTAEERLVALDRAVAAMGVIGALGRLQEFVPLFQYMARWWSAEATVASYQRAAFDDILETTVSRGKTPTKRPGLRRWLCLVALPLISIAKTVRLFQRLRSIGADLSLKRIPRRTRRQTERLSTDNPNLPHWPRTRNWAKGGTPA
jgi:hypothetical protein